MLACTVEQLPSVWIEREGIKNLKILQTSFIDGPIVLCYIVGVGGIIRPKTICQDGFSFDTT